MRCRKDGVRFGLSVSATSSTVEAISATASSISSGLSGGYAVTGADTDVASNQVVFAVEDVTVDRTLRADSVAGLCSGDPTRLCVQEGTSIDLTTSGSMIIAGKTRSGKTTGVIALLLQVLAAGLDGFGSQVMIIDPKGAELSRLPHVVAPDPDGSARAVLAAMEGFEQTIRRRQQMLNDLSTEKGDAVHWWEAGMHVSLIFIDEYVALRGLFPSRASKDDPGYSLPDFDALLKRIVTMGASAGCYVIVAIAEASVGEGGIPSMLKGACSTKVLFRPTPDEGRLLWDAGRVAALPTRTYGPGDAWFSSTDGVHDGVSCVHFPVMDFPVYEELGRLLGEYYAAGDGTDLS